MTSYCLISPDNEITLRTEFDPETDVWNIDPGWRIAPESECGDLPDAAPPPPRNVFRVEPEGFYMSTAADAASDYTGLMMAYQLQRQTGAIADDTVVAIGAEGRVFTITYKRFVEIMAAYATRLVQLRLSGG
jgi:hypothetical protein